MLKYGRHEKGTFCVFIGNDRHKLFYNLYFYYRNAFINLCCCEFLVLMKGLFLTWATPTLPIFDGGKYNVVGT